MYYAIKKGDKLYPIVVNAEKDIAGIAGIVKSDKPIKIYSTLKDGKVVKPVDVVKPAEPARTTLETLNEKLDILIAKQKGFT